MGTVVISIDAELGWGFHDLSSPSSARIDNARRGWSTLLELLAEYDLPATWAVVGHLFLPGCDGRHADHPAPPGWFSPERTRWRDRPELRFGGDLLEDLLASSVDHEVACHSFSHVIFDEDRTSRELARAELDASIEAARAWDVSFTSFVYPRNRVGHRDVLAEAGFRCYRGAAPDAGRRNRVTRPVGKLVRTTLLEPSPTVVHPHLDEHGLVNVPASLFLFSLDGVTKRLVEPVWGNPVVRTVRRGVDAVTDDDGVFHLWLHPNNIHREGHARQLREVFSLVAERASSSDLSVETMAAVAERVRRENGVGPAEPTTSNDLPTHG